MCGWINAVPVAYVNSHYKLTGCFGLLLSIAGTRVLLEVLPEQPRCEILRVRSALRNEVCHQRYLPGEVPAARAGCSRSITSGSSRVCRSPFRTERIYRWLGNASARENLLQVIIRWMTSTIEELLLEHPRSKLWQPPRTSVGAGWGEMHWTV